MYGDSNDKPHREEYLEFVSEFFVHTVLQKQD